MLSKIKLLGLVLMAAAIGLPAAARADKKIWISTPEHHIARIPVMGCPSEGDGGSSPPPPNSEKIIEIDKKFEHSFVFYKAATSPLVLAPIGWNCLGIYGANGSTLYIAPELIRKEDLYAHDGGFSGPAIEVSEIDGDTPGRFEVARVIARVFPAHKAFAQKVISEGVEPAESFPFGPYPTDQVTNKGDDMIEFQTPPGTEGLGTTGKLRQNKEPIDGAVKLAGLMSDKMFRVTVRVRPDDKALKAVIIQQFEKDNPEEPSGN